MQNIQVELKDGGPEYFFVCPYGHEKNWGGTGWYFIVKGEIAGPYTIREVQDIQKIYSITEEKIENNNSSA